MYSNTKYPSSYLKRVSIWVVYFLASCMTSIATAQSAGVPQGWESYLNRPDILTLDSQAAEMSEGWFYLKAAHFSFVAYLLEMYPGEHIYFLARDAEYLYDVARLATENTPDAERIHLLNISTVNVRSPQLLDYLADNGITEEKMAAGKKILFVDTGFAGTIPLAVARKFSKEATANFHTQLIESENPSLFPQSETFLSYMTAEDNKVEGNASERTSLVQYEHMPRYFDRSTKYVAIDGHLHPISPIGQENDGQVAKEDALKNMKAFRYAWSQETTKNRFRYETARFRFFKKMVESHDVGDREQIRKKAILLENYLKTTSADERRLAEVGLTDVLTAAASRGNNVSFLRGLLGSSLTKPDRLSTKRKALLKLHPEWTQFLTDPNSGARLLFKTESWSVIESLLFSQPVDSEILIALSRQLFSGPAQGRKRELQLDFLRKIDGQSPTIRYLFPRSIEISFPHEAPVVAQALFEIHPVESNLGLLKAYLGTSFANENRSFVRKLFQKNNQQVNRVLARELKVPANDTMLAQALKDLILSSPPETLAAVANREDLGEMPDIMRLLIATGDKNNIKRALSAAIQSKNIVLFEADIYRFSQRYPQDFSDLVVPKMLMSPYSKLIPRTMVGLVEDTQAKYLGYYIATSMRNLSDIPDFYKALVAKAPPKMIETMKSWTPFWEAFVSRPEYLLLKQAVDAAPAERAKLLQQKFDVPISAPPISCEAVF